MSQTGGNRNIEKNRNECKSGYLFVLRFDSRNGRMASSHYR